MKKIIKRDFRMHDVGMIVFYEAICGHQRKVYSFLCAGLRFEYTNLVAQLPFILRSYCVFGFAVLASNILPDSTYSRLSHEEDSGVNGFSGQATDGCYLVK